MALSSLALGLPPPASQKKKPAAGSSGSRALYGGYRPYPVSTVEPTPLVLLRRSPLRRRPVRRRPLFASRRDSICPKLGVLRIVSKRTIPGMLVGVKSLMMEAPWIRFAR